MNSVFQTSGDSNNEGSTSKFTASRPPMVSTDLIDFAYPSNQGRRVSAPVGSVPKVGGFLLFDLIITCTFLYILCYCMTQLMFCVR